MANKKCKCKCKCKEPKMEFMHIWDMDTFQCKDNEIYMGGVYWDEELNKKDITLVFTTYQFLEWLNGNTEYIKTQLKEYIDTLG